MDGNLRSQLEQMINPNTTPSVAPNYQPVVNQMEAKTVNKKKISFENIAIIIAITVVVLFAIHKSTSTKQNGVDELKKDEDDDEEEEYETKKNRHYDPLFQEFD